MENENQWEYDVQTIYASPTGSENLLCPYVEPFFPVLNYIE
jgi:hypothetical protein